MFVIKNFYKVKKFNTETELIFLKITQLCVCVYC